MMIPKLFAGALLALALTGCGGLSGLGGSSSYSCPMPDGSTCKSMSDAYRDTYRPSASAAASPASGDTVSAVAPAAASPAAKTASVTPAELGTPLLSGPRVMRVLIAPWTDASNDLLMEERRVLVKLSDSQWRLEHFTATRVKNFRPIRPPAASSSDAVASPSPTK